MCEQLSVSECEPDECLGRVLRRAGKALSLAGPGALDLPSSHLCFGIENIKKHKPGSCSLYSEHVEAQFIVLFIVRNAWLSWIVKSGAPLISVCPPSEQGLQARCAQGPEARWWVPAVSAAPVETRPQT